MQSLIPLIQLSVVFGFLCGSVILYMQVRAYRRHKQKFFIVLINSTVFAFAASALAAYSYFVPTGEAQAIALYRLSIPLGMVATALATWGSVQFLRAYDEK